MTEHTLALGNDRDKKLYVYNETGRQVAKYPCDEAIRRLLAHDDMVSALEDCVHELDRLLSILTEEDEQHVMAVIAVAREAMDKAKGGT